MKTCLLMGIAATVFSVQTSYCETITMSEYLNRVSARHPLFITEAMQPRIESLRRDRFRGAEDWVVHSDPFVNFQKPIVSNTFSADRLTVFGVGASAQRPFWGNGSRLALSWEATITDQDLPGIVIPSTSGPITIPVGPSSFYENRISVTYSYPLLQNRGGILDRLGYELGNYNIDFARIESLENQENFLFEVGVRFIDWALVLEETRIDRERLSLEEEQLAQMKRKRRANLVDEVDVRRAEAALEIAQENVVFKQSLARAKQAELAVIALDDSIYEATPDVDLYRLESLPPIADVIEQLSSHRIVNSLDVRVRRLRTQKHALESVAKPRLYLGVTGGLQEGDEDFADSWVLDRPDITVFVDFRYPLGNRTARADVEKIRVEIRQLEKQTESVSLDLEARLRSVWIQIDEFEKVLALNQEQISTARKKTIEEQRVYNQGRGDLTFVIQSRDNESLAKLRYAVNAANYQKLVLNYRALVDELLPGD
ncbi:MAG: TolC family protein [Candidatus Krumholzibacteria bacterium]|nr:TolC family protein [Candidatus Krumholzibacteria bacterium]